MFRNSKETLKVDNHFVTATDYENELRRIYSQAESITMAKVDCELLHTFSNETR